LRLNPRFKGSVRRFLTESFPEGYFFEENPKNFPWLEKFAVNVKTAYDLAAE
jgi:hypothetical protein